MTKRELENIVDNESLDIVTRAKALVKINKMENRLIESYTQEQEEVMLVQCEDFLKSY